MDKLIINTALLNQHNISFEFIYIELWKRQEFRARGGALAEFLSEFFESYGEVIFQEAIDLIDVYLNGGEDPLGDNSLGVNSDQIFATFDNQTVDIYIYNNSPTEPITVLQSLPLQDFKDIMIMAWEFINS